MNKTRPFINPSTRIILKERNYLLEKPIGENELYEIWQGTRNIFSAAANAEMQRRRYRIYLLKRTEEHEAFPNIEAVKDEVRLLSHIYHKNCPYIEDAGEIEINTRKTFFFTEHWWEGISLREVLLQAKLLSTPASKFFIPIGVALWTLREIADALDHIHNLKDDQQHPLNIVHRDIKPENIFYTREGKIIISGFSSSKSTLNLYHTMAGQIRGISQYTAPERLLASDKTDGCKADIFSLGCVLFEMITGIPRMRVTTSGLPDFDSLQRKVNLQAIRNTIHPRLEKIIYKMTSYDADNRFENTEEVRYEIDVLLDVSPYRCFTGDIAGFIRYVIDKDQESYLSIQRLTEREHKFLKNKKKMKSIILQKNPPISKALPLTSKVQDNMCCKTDPAGFENNMQEFLPETKNQLTNEHWSAIQRKLNEAMEVNKTKRIEKSKVVFISVGIILVLFIICIMTLAFAFFKKNNSAPPFPQNLPAETASDSFRASVIDYLTISKDYLSNKRNGKLILQLTILPNSAVVTQLRSIEGATPQAKNQIIKQAYEKIQSIDWSPYIGRSFTYTYTLVGK